MDTYVDHETQKGLPMGSAEIIIEEHTCRVSAPVCNRRGGLEKNVETGPQPGRNNPPPVALLQPLDARIVQGARTCGSSGNERGRRMVVITRHTRMALHPSRCLTLLLS